MLGPLVKAFLRQEHIPWHQCNQPLCSPALPAVMAFSVLHQCVYSDCGVEICFSAPRLLHNNPHQPHFWSRLKHLCCRCWSYWIATSCWGTFNLICEETRDPGTAACPLLCTDACKGEIGITCLALQQSGPSWSKESSHVETNQQREMATNLYQGCKLRWMVLTGGLVVSNVLRI